MDFEKLSNIKGVRTAGKRYFHQESNKTTRFEGRSTINSGALFCNDIFSHLTAADLIDAEPYQ
ncbi:MAG: hypothetical protein EOM14_03010 [Clostridia bacterium]|nr:hypothetical protein [Clostridia bacterium]